LVRCVASFNSSFGVSFAVRVSFDVQGTQGRGYAAKARAGSRCLNMMRVSRYFD
jgi:hypothetical protein